MQYSASNKTVTMETLHHSLLRSRSFTLSLFLIHYFFSFFSLSSFCHSLSLSLSLSLSDFPSGVLLLPVSLSVSPPVFPLPLSSVDSTSSLPLIGHFPHMPIGRSITDGPIPSVQSLQGVSPPNHADPLVATTSRPVRRWLSGRPRECCRSSPRTPLPAGAPPPRGGVPGSWRAGGR